MIVLSTEATLQEMAKQALRHRLYVPGWQAYSLFTDIVNDELKVKPSVQMAMYYFEGGPIAWVLRWNKPNLTYTPSYEGCIWRFTRTKFRNLHISSMLATKLCGIVHKSNHSNVLLHDN